VARVTATGERVDGPVTIVARAIGRLRWLAAKPLDLRATTEVRIGWSAPPPIARGVPRLPQRVEQLNRWDPAGAERELGRALAIDMTFGLPYKLASPWLTGGTND
jgi:hypothetical protein